MARLSVNEHKEFCEKNRALGNLKRRVDEQRRRRLDRARRLQLLIGLGEFENDFAAAFSLRGVHNSGFRFA